MDSRVTDFTPNICFIEDDPVMGESLRQHLTMEGFEVELYKRNHTTHEDLCQNSCDIMLCDSRSSDVNGIDFYNKLVDGKCKVPPMVFITEYGTVEHAADLLTPGAADNTTKTFDPESLINKLKAITITPKVPKTKNNGFVLGVSSSILAIQSHLNRLARYNETPLLITGETGVGKEVVARYLHKQQNNHGPFVAINCSAIPESLIESELFGHENGAFTGATRTHKGVFEQAENGTLLLDEIADLPFFLQAKLLRVLQERTFKRVGGEKEIKITSRLIFATNKDLEQQVSKGLFREDLFYRINVVHTPVPPLRERKDDILWLADHFIKEHQNKYPDIIIDLDESAKHVLMNHHWTGNVRELKHTIEHACIMCNGTIVRKQDISIHPNIIKRSNDFSGTTLKEYLELCEKEKIEAVLLQNHGCISQSAEQLDICRKSLWEKMKKYNIEK